MGRVIPPGCIQQDGPKFMYTVGTSASRVGSPEVNRDVPAHPPDRRGGRSNQGLSPNYPGRALKVLNPIPLLFHRGTARVFFVIPQAPSTRRVRERAGQGSPGVCGPTTTISSGCRKRAGTARSLRRFNGVGATASTPNLSITREVREDAIPGPRTVRSPTQHNRTPP